MQEIQETGVRSLGQEDPVEKEMATRSSIRAWEIPRTEECGRLQSMESHGAGHDWARKLYFIHGINVDTSEHRLLFIYFFWLSKTFFPWFEFCATNTLSWVMPWSKRIRMVNSFPDPDSWDTTTEDPAQFHVTEVFPQWIIPTLQVICSYVRTFHLSSVILVCWFHFCFRL